MSKNIESYYLKQNMREDLMQCYREVAPTCITQYGAWRKTVNHPAKRYYVTAKQCMQILSKYFQGEVNVVEHLKHNRREMYHNLIREVSRLMASPEHHNDSLMKMCKIAILQPAPKFFICPEYMAKIFSHIKHNEYDADGRLTTSFPSKKIDYNERYRQQKIDNGTER